MLANRRLAKRSIIGTKVSAVRQDGRYYPGVIQAQRDDGSAVTSVYCIQFEDGCRHDVTPTGLVGPGFQSIAAVVLKPGQNVYLTMNGREVSGRVVEHRQDTDEVSVALPFVNNAYVTRKLDDFRLLKSRKSARLLDQDTDYCKLADVHTEAKKPAVSHVIDVPSKTDHQRAAYGGENDVEMMDEQMAAMVLTSLSCSPHSPIFPSSIGDEHKAVDQSVAVATTNDVQLPSSVSSSGFHSVHSDQSDPSPPHYGQSDHSHYSLSESAPATTGQLYGSYGMDDGIDLEENIRQYYDDPQEYKRKKPAGQTKIMYKCTWPKCGKLHSTCSTIEKHVRSRHLGLEDRDTNLSDHEEEFYYSEIEVTVDSVTQSFNDMYASSPPTHSYIEMAQDISDHDYQRKEHRFHSPKPASVPSAGFITKNNCSTPIPIDTIKRSVSWQNNFIPQHPMMPPSQRAVRPSPEERLQQHQAASPKTHLLASPTKPSSAHKKSRSDVRKCRKVYGMDNRDSWCTQCKWKKACTRFLE